MPLQTPHATRWLAGWPRPTSLTVAVAAAGTDPTTGEPAAAARDAGALTAGTWTVASRRNDDVSTDPDAVTAANGDGGALLLTLDLDRIPVTVAPDRLIVAWTPDGSAAAQDVAVVRLSTSPPVTAAAAAAAGWHVADRSVLARDIAIIEAEQCSRRTFVTDLGTFILPAGRRLLPADLDVQHIVRIEPLDGSAHITDPALIPDVDRDISAVIPDHARPLPACGSRIVAHCGIPTMPPDLADAVARRWRHWATSPETAIPSQATSYAIDGTTYRLAVATRYRTGDQTVDAVYSRHRSPVL